MLAQAANAPAVSDAAAAGQAAAAAVGRATKGGTIKTSSQGAPKPITTERSLQPITGTKSAFGG